MQSALGRGFLWPVKCFKVQRVCSQFFFFFPHKPQKPPPRYAPITVGCYNKWNNENTTGSQVLLRRVAANTPAESQSWLSCYSSPNVFLQSHCIMPGVQAITCYLTLLEWMLRGPWCDSKGNWTIINSLCDTRTQRLEETFLSLPANFFFNRYLSLFSFSLS